MTIDEVMATVVDYRIAVFQGDDAMTASALRTVRNAVKALVATERDAEAEACAALCVDECNRAMDQYTLKEKDPTQRSIYGAMGVAATNCRDAIRARIAARKGGNDGR
jgi:hypothetical protein